MNYRFLLLFISVIFSYNYLSANGSSESEYEFKWLDFTNEIRAKYPENESLNKFIDYCTIFFESGFREENSQLHTQYNKVDRSKFLGFIHSPSEISDKDTYRDFSADQLALLSKYDENISVLCDALYIEDIEWPEELFEVQSPSNNSKFSQLDWYYPRKVLFASFIAAEKAENIDKAIRYAGALCRLGILASRLQGPRIMALIHCNTGLDGFQHLLKHYTLTAQQYHTVLQELKYMDKNYSYIPYFRERLLENFDQTLADLEIELETFKPLDEFSNSNVQAKITEYHEIRKQQIKEAHENSETILDPQVQKEYHQNVEEVISFYEQPYYVRGSADHPHLGKKPFFNRTVSFKAIEQELLLMICFNRLLQAEVYKHTNQVEKIKLLKDPFSNTPLQFLNEKTYLLSPDMTDQAGMVKFTFQRGKVSEGDVFLNNVGHFGALHK